MYSTDSSQFLFLSGISLHSKFPSSLSSPIPSPSCRLPSTSLARPHEEKLSCDLLRKDTLATVPPSYSWLSGFYDCVVFLSDNAHWTLCCLRLGSPGLISIYFVLSFSYSAQKKRGTAADQMPSCFPLAYWDFCAPLPSLPPSFFSWLSRLPFPLITLISPGVRV